MKKLICIAVALFAVNANAACKWVWVDHDYNSMTPAIQKQVCNSTLDLPSIRTPSIRPIQQPQLRPLEPIGLPPLGTTSCRMQSVYEFGRWVNKRICR